MEYMTECDGSCFAAHDINNEFGCEDGTLLTFFFCRHYSCWILTTFAPPQEEYREEVPHLPGNEP